MVLGTDDWAIEQAAASLEVGGYRVLRCHEPGQAAFPCDALVPGRTCPLDAGAEVAVTSRARPIDTPTAAEMGVVCALHAQLPLVITGISRGAPFAPWAAEIVPDRGDLADVVADVVAEQDHAEAAVIRLPADAAP